VLSLWIPLADVDEQTGTLALAKGSHREMLPMEAPSDSRYRFSRGSEHHARLKPERMRLGDVLAFHSMTLREHTKDLGIPTCPPLPGCSAELTLAIRRLRLRWHAPGADPAARPVVHRHALQRRQQRAAVGVRRLPRAFPRA